MKFFFLLFFLISCSEKNSNYFPLDKIKSWTYVVEIIPEVESKILYKKTNTSIGEKKNKYSKSRKKILLLLLSGSVPLIISGFLQVFSEIYGPFNIFN